MSARFYEIDIPHRMVYNRYQPATSGAVGRDIKRLSCPAESSLSTAPSTFNRASYNLVDMMPTSSRLLMASLGLAVNFARTLHAYQTIAHRGLFHDVSDVSAIAENTVSALQRAAVFGLPGAEFDVRLSVDGIPFTTHDMISNRATVQDNAKGVMNPIDVLLGQQPAPSPIYINQQHAAFWDLVPLKTYGRGGKIIRPGGDQKMETLEAMLGHLLNMPQTNFKLFLDIQDPATFTAAAALVKQTGTQNRVFLKFFVKKAIEDNGRYKGHEASTCYQYAKDHGFDGLQIIPQFNDGELTIVGNNAYVSLWGEQMLTTELLSCWFDAQSEYQTQAAQVSIVAASVPYGNNPAHAAGSEALLWASEYGRARMSILPNPDAGRRSGNTCTLYSWDSTHVTARIFDKAGHDDKEQFARAYITSNDYLVVDVMGDVENHVQSTDFTYFTNNLC